MCLYISYFVELFDNKGKITFTGIYLVNKYSDNLLTRSFILINSYHHTAQ